MTNKPLVPPHNRSFDSQLPHWKVGDVYRAPFGDRDNVLLAEITCPRTKCGCMLVVDVARFWDRNSIHMSGPCGYCFRTAWRGKRPTRVTA